MNAFDKFGRPCKELYFMNICFDVALRSIDPNTKHGCVAVSESGSILSTGYNGPVAGSDDNLVPLERPSENNQILHKYNFLLHAEDNCVTNAAKQGACLKDSYFYVTGIPCLICMQRVINIGAKEIIYGPLCSKMTSSEEYMEGYSKIFSLIPKSIILKPFSFEKELFEMNKKAEEASKDAVKLNLRFPK
jgi:dCMP deaminase